MGAGRVRVNREPNDYPMGSPEWQLLELAISAEQAARAFDADAERCCAYTERYRVKSAEQRTRADAYRAALAKVTSAP